MIFYFAITDKMIEKYGMSERPQQRNTFNWKLSYCNESFLGATLCDTPGKVLDALKHQNLLHTENTVIIVRAIATDADMLDGLRAVLVGDTIKSVNVVIDEVTYVKNRYGKIGEY
jgi:hypothetical protein